jgi:serine protease Do
MTETVSLKFLRRTAIAGAAAVALFAGFAAAPALLAHGANAQEINPSGTVVAPPNGAPMSFADLIERVRPAVVSISVRQRPDAATGPQIEGLPPGFEEFFRGRPGRPGPAPTALGSGFFINESGVIVTNHHVIEGAEEITVRTSEGRELQADIVGSDEATDIAVLRIRGGGRFPYVTFDDASHVRVGDWVVAVGNPFGLDGTATAGIVSAMGRRDAGSSAYVDYMQIDAPINRGNSGGPTFDLRGNVIGVNSAIFSPTGGNVGIGFAIPANTANGIVQQILRSGRVTRGWIGVSIQPLDEDIARSLGLDEPRGALIASVVPDGPAARAGLQQGDVILTFDGQRIEDSRDLTQRVGATAIGRTSRVEIMRAGARRTLQLRLAERPSEQQLASANQPPDVTPPAPEGESGGVAQSSLGVTVRPMTQEDRARYQLQANETGLVVTAVDPASDAAEKGVRAGDVILQAGGRSVRTARELTAATDAARRAGRPLLLQVDGRAGRRFIAADVGDR